MLFWTIKLMHALQKNLKVKQNVNKKIKIILNLAIMVAYLFLVYLCFKFLFSLSPFCFFLSLSHTDTHIHTWDLFSILCVLYTNYASIKNKTNVF